MSPILLKRIERKENQHNKNKKWGKQMPKFTVVILTSEVT